HGPTSPAAEPCLMETFAKPVADRSFNQVTVDGDSSTNDTFLVLANGAAGNDIVRPGTSEAQVLETAIVEVARELARAIARDGEGATRMIAVRVHGAEADDEARTAARPVASSRL